MNDFTKLWKIVTENVTFLVVSIVMILAVYLLALGIEKRCKIRLRSEKTKVKRLTVIAMFAAIAAILMFFEFPLWFAPAFYEMDFSEVPALIGAFMFGPTAGVAIEALKELLKIVLKGTTTAFVGDLANFIIGCSFVIPASAVYFIKKSRKSAIVGIVAGGVIMIAVGSLMNAFYLLPKFSQLYGLPMDALIAMGTKVNAGIHSIFTLVALAVTPFNALKALIVGMITIVLYKYISRLIKGQDGE